MRTADISGFCWWIPILVLGLTGDEAHGLTIYRFGGEAHPLPSEAGQEGVEFVQLDWTDLDAAQGGETFELDLDEQAIRALEHDPQVNIAPTVSERGGLVYKQDIYGVAFDGDLNTVWPAQRYLCAEFRATIFRCTDDYHTAGTANLSLGGLFLIDRVRVVSGLDNPAAVVRNLRLHLSSTVPKLSYGLSGPRTPIVEIRDNWKTTLDIPIPPREPAAFFQIALGEHNETWDVAEVQVFARGYVDRSTYVSNILDFGAPAAWGTLRWAGRRDPGAKVFIQTRSGADDEPVRYWRYTGRGDDTEEVTRSEYDKLKLGEDAGTTHDRDHWTFWSAPYEFADSLGTPVVSLSPRRYLQLKVDFLPEGDSGGEVEFVELRASVPPAASAVVGEIDPVRVEVGEESRFTYALKPSLKGDDTGFDRLEMTTSSMLGEVEAVRIGELEVPFAVEAQEAHRFEISFPRVEQRDSGVLIEVVFAATPLRYGSAFDARVFDSTRPFEVRQTVSAGDATDRFEANQVSVITTVEGRSLVAASTSGVCTPDGDGVNDAVRVSYDLFESIGAVPVRVEILDLAGRLVYTVYEGTDQIGRYEQWWNGTDGAGALVPPGVYLYRVSVEADEEKVDKVGTIHVAY